MLNLYEQGVAYIMRKELESRGLDVCLVPSLLLHQPTERKRRVVIDRNPDWYRRLCAMHQSGRTRQRRKKHGDTLIKRQHTLRALAELENGRLDTEYAHRLVPFVKQFAADFLSMHMMGADCESI